MANKSAEIRLSEDTTESIDIALATVLFDMVDESKYYSISSITQRLLGYYGYENKWINERFVGRALKRLGFTNKRVIDGKTQVLLTKKDAELMAKRLNIQSLKRYQEGSQDTSTNSTNSTNSTENKNGNQS